MRASMLACLAEGARQHPPDLSVGSGGFIGWQSALVLRTLENFCMASANLELVRSICAARERGDYSSIEWADPNIEYVLADGPTPAKWLGLAQLADGMRDFLSAWDGFRAEVEAYRELDDERVLVLLRFAGRGKSSGLELAETAPKGANVFHLRDGKITGIVHYFDRERAVSEQNMETLRRAYDAYDRRDVRAMQALSHDDCVIYTVVEGRAEPQPFRGRNGIRAWIENENDVWESVKIEDLDLRDLGDDRVFTVAVARVRGKGSGIELSTPVWSICELRDGKIFRFRSYPDRAEALEAAGLSDQEG